MTPVQRFDVTGGTASPDLSRPSSPLLPSLLLVKKKPSSASLLIRGLKNSLQHSSTSLPSTSILTVTTSTSTTPIPPPTQPDTTSHQLRLILICRDDDPCWYRNQLIIVVQRTIQLDRVKDDSTRRCESLIARRPLQIWMRGSLLLHYGLVGEVAGGRGVWC